MISQPSRVLKLDILVDGDKQTPKRAKHWKSISGVCAAQAWCWLILLLFTGCSSKETLNTEYGKLQSTKRTASLNGTRIFAELFRQAGATVSRFTEINPRLEKYETIVWMPDSSAAPSEEVCDALEAWLNKGYTRTLIYVGRNYTAQLDYFERIRDRVDDDQREEMLRWIAESQTSRRIYNSKHPFLSMLRPNQCRWFLTRNLNRETSSRISGKLADMSGVEECRLDLGMVLSPSEDSLDDDPENHLLYADDVLFAWRIPFDDYGSRYGDNQVIVVANGSFLLNYSLTNPNHVKLANALIEMCDTSHPVAFLESDEWGPHIRETAAQHQPWSWISQPPLRYVVPHVLLWGIMLCFTLYPIFGRARRFRVKQSFDDRSEDVIYRQVSTTSFKSHVVAMGKLLQRSEPRDDAEAKIRKYRETS